MTQQAKPTDGNLVTTSTYQERLNALRSDPSTSFWLLSAADGLHQRDPLDAVNDAQQLYELMGARLNELLVQVE